MRLGLFVFVVALASAASAAAQTSITLNADPVPIVDAEINGRPVRLEVDLRFPRGLALSTAAAERLHVQRVPFVAIEVGVEGSEARLRGRLARPRLLFNGRSTRAFTGILPVPVSTRADGVIGPGVLPYDVVTIILGPEPEHGRDIVLTLDDADEWEASTQAGGQTLRLDFDVADQASTFNRTAARLFDQSGAIRASGDLTEIAVHLGLSALAQPVETELIVEGLSLGPTYARTNAPLLGAIEDDALIVEAEADHPAPAAVTLGRNALSHCSSIRVDRRTRQLTLHCAA